jgi:hypothetical protein
MAVPVLLGVALYLTARTFVFPGVPVLLVGYLGFFWMNADRMLHGERLYRDFFQFTPPGLDVLYAAIFALLGARIWVVNAVTVGVGVALAGAVFHVARGLVKDVPAALATSLFVVFVYGQPLVVTHHWVSVLLVLAAVPVVTPPCKPMGPSRVRLAVAGALLGLAAFCTQSHGLSALGAFVLFIGWQARVERTASGVLLQRSLWLVAPLVVVLLSASAYFIVTSGIRPIWECTVVYVWRYMTGAPPGWRLGLYERPSWTNLSWISPYLAVYGMIPLGYGLAARRWRRERRRASGSRFPFDAEARVALLWLVGVALLLEVTVTLSWLRLFCVSAPAIVLLVWASDEGGRTRSLAQGSAWAASVVLGAVLIRSTARHHATTMDLPAGRAAIGVSERDKLDWLTAHLQSPGDSLFAADRPPLYLPLGVRNVLFIDAVQPNAQTSLYLATRTVDDLRRAEPSLILWSAELESIRTHIGLEGVNLIASYLHAHYHFVRAFTDGDEAWQRD